MTMWNPNSEPTTNLSGNPEGTDPTIKHLDSLLRGEISATETYRMVIDSVGDDPQYGSQLAVLRQMQADHGRAAQWLRSRIRELGGEASDSSGAWGAWAKFTQGTANLFGDTASLKSLKEGEEHGLKQYEACRDDVDTVTLEAITRDYIPQQHQHIESLDELMKSSNSN